MAGEAPPDVLKLVERFERGRHTYCAPGYNETQVRREFIDPLFKTLGWDVDNTAGYAEAYKDVVHEDRVRVEGASKAPDYAFRVGGTRKFLVEAKKPSVNLRDDPLPAYQLRRYSWNAKLPLGVLTDFDEFVVYDCRSEAKPGDRASANRLLYIKCDEYGSRWSEIEDVFSREAVLLGSFDEYAISLKGKRGTAEVDQTFLAEMETWREELARNLILRNDLSQRELNYAVQQTIDRIVFLRICEDRTIEPYGQLQGVLNADDVYSHLLVLFQRADDRYNSGLFHFRAESGREEAPDRLTPSLTIDSSVLKRMIRRLYYPESPYEFAVLPADILGQVYEQFLGKTIRKTSARRIAVEEKPEVKKAGGIVYTPTPVVDYIIKHSVTRLLDGQSLAQVEGSGRVKSAHPFRVLDPACGSGSFLIGAYQHLLDWHLARYLADPDKWSKGRVPRLRATETGEWRLSAGERRRILLAHIYGVDIDPQAVEVTKLSLLLKVLEGESNETIGQQMGLFQARALPDLAANIRCGNSLIGSDFDRYHAGTLFGEDDVLRVNAFDWRDEFPDVFDADGGFDVVLGNPPYVLLQGAFRDDEQLAYFRDTFQVASYKLDLYHLFIEQSVRLARSGGMVSMITPANFLTNNYLDRLRKLLLDETKIDHVAIIDRGVFRGRSVDNAIFAVAAGSQTENFALIPIEPTPAGWLAGKPVRLVAETIRADAHVLFTGGGSPERDALWQRVDSRSVRLGDIAFVNFGKQLRDRRSHETDVVRARSLREVKPPYRPCYTGVDTDRYRVTWNRLACLDSEDARRGGCWDRDKQNAINKLLTKQIGRHPEFALDRLGYQCLNTMFMVNLTDEGYSPEFLLGYLNSTMIKALWLDRYYDRRRTFPKIKGTFLKELRVPHLSDSPEDRQWHDAVVHLARRLIDFYDAHANSATDHERTGIARAIRASEHLVDRLVFEYFDLSAAEIAMVEEASTS